MSLGETIDAIRYEHASQRADHTACWTCDSIARIQRAYEEMTLMDFSRPEPRPSARPRPLPATKPKRTRSVKYEQVLNTIGPLNTPAEDESYKSVLVRDPDFEKEEAA